MVDEQYKLMLAEITQDPGFAALSDENKQHELCLRVASWAELFFRAPSAGRSVGSSFLGGSSSASGGSLDTSSRCFAFPSATLVQLLEGYAVDQLWARDDWFAREWLHASGLASLPWPARAAAYAEALHREHRPEHLRHLALAWHSILDLWLEDSTHSAAKRAELRFAAPRLRASAEGLKSRLQQAGVAMVGSRGQQTPLALLDSLMRRLAELM